MYLQISGYFLKTLSPKCKENILKLNNPKLACNFPYNDSLGGVSFFGLLEYDGMDCKNNSGEIYDNTRLY